MKKVIRTSNLMLRFYKSDGWTEDELNGLCSQGQVICAHPEDEDPYYTLGQGGQFDIDRLMDATEYIDRRFPEQHNMLDRELIGFFNW